MKTRDLKNLKQSLKRMKQVRVYPYSIPSQKEASFNKSVSRTGLFGFMLSFSLLQILNASGVRSDLPYQDFRDFAENKGKFRPGAMNIPIYDKLGRLVGYEMRNAPMPDMSASDLNGVSSLVDVQHVASVKHNVGYKKVQFGTIAGRLNQNAVEYEYQIVNRYNAEDHNQDGKLNQLDSQGKPTNKFHSDQHMPRLEKWVTEVAPMPISTHKGSIDDFILVRKGSGDQKICENGIDENTDCKLVADAYKYLTGGHLSPAKPGAQMGNNGGFDTIGGLYDGAYDGPLVTHQLPGDSGSPIYGYNPKTKEWAYIGNVAALAVWNVGGKKIVVNWNLTAKPELLKIALEIEKGITIENTNGDELHWSVDNASADTAKKSILRFGKTMGNGNQYNLDISNKTTEKDPVKIAATRDHGKHLRLTGKRGKLVLEGDMDQGAGGIYFDTDYEVVSAQNSTNARYDYQGAGIQIKEGKNVQWKINFSKSNDRLSKLGQGTLEFSPEGIKTGENLGRISVGEGKLVLNQNAQGNNYTYRVDIVSGRGLVELGKNSDAKDHLKEIYFGFRGGKLDLNGQIAKVDHIRHVDEGANILNLDATQESTLELTGDRPQSFKDLNGGDRMDNFHNTVDGKGKRYDFYIQRPNGYNRKTYDIYVMMPPKDKLEASHLEVRYSPEWHFYKYNDMSKECAVCVKVATVDSIEEATALLGDGSNFEERMKKLNERQRQNVINALQKIFSQTQDLHNQTYFLGFLGSRNLDQAQGVLNLKYNPKTQNESLLLGGGSNLTGKLEIEKGKVLLQGLPTVHARDAIKKEEVIYDWDYQNVAFRFKSIDLKNHTKLSVGRNVGALYADLNLGNQAQVILGYSVGDEALVVNHTFGDVRDFTSRVTQAGYALMPTTQIYGNATMQASSSLTLGSKGELWGKISGEKTSQVTLKPKSKWHLSADSTVGNLSLSDATIELSAKDNVEETILKSTFKNQSLLGKVTLPDVVNATNSPRSVLPPYHRLDVLGSFQSTQGKLIYNTNISQNYGDELVVHGDALGDLELVLRNSGNEPSWRDLVLVEVKGQTQDFDVSLRGGYVDVGAYRYKLLNKKDKGTTYYYLGSLLGEDGLPQRDKLSLYGNSILSEYDNFRRILQGQNAAIAGLFLEDLDYRQSVAVKYSFYENHPDNEKLRPYRSQIHDTLFAFNSGGQENVHKEQFSIDSEEESSQDSKKDLSAQGDLNTPFETPANNSPNNRDLSGLYARVIASFGKISAEFADGVSFDGGSMRLQSGMRAYLKNGSLLGFDFGIIHYFGNIKVLGHSTTLGRYVPFASAKVAHKWQMSGNLYMSLGAGLNVLFYPEESYNISGSLAQISSYVQAIPFAQAKLSLPLALSAVTLRPSVMFHAEWSSKPKDLYVNHHSLIQEGYFLVRALANLGADLPKNWKIDFGVGVQKQSDDRASFVGNTSLRWSF